MEHPNYYAARDMIDNALSERPDVPDVVRQAMAEEMQAQFIAQKIVEGRQAGREYDATVELADPEAVERGVREDLETKSGPLVNVLMMRQNAEQRRQLQGPPR